ncbi:helix-turn-helix domain-containing protein [Nocardiopsis sp. CA-288880]|uniref:helix-turn-helix domain-containing protein n=1 Tax=Nocardiopsis sp. CA-288880 TaxID=3239995 RepID=UPI003D97BD7A
MNQFGAELRHLRELSDLSQRELGERTKTSKQQVGSIERGERRASKYFAEQADKVLNSHGRLQDLWPGARRTQPWWFQQYVDIEEKAQIIHEFQPQAVPGLLQTEGYADAVLGASFPPLPPQEREPRLLARMERQKIIDRDEPPLLLFIVEEGALLRSVGKPGLMRAQWSHILKQVEKDHVQVQVMPYGRGAHGALNGAFIILKMTFLESVVYAEVPGGGHVIADHGIVARCQERFGSLRSMALSPAESTEYIASLKE